MERHIGTWYKENDSSKSEVGELLIDGNHIEFYSRYHGEVFPTTFVGSDGEYRYKIFVNGASKSSNNRLLDHTSSHRVFYVLMQNFGFSHGTDISEIIEFSFRIPELIKWLGINTVFYGNTNENEMAAGELHIDPIILHIENPHIELYFESKTFNCSLRCDDRISITIKKEPRIKVIYTKPQNIQSVINDIECLMQFFGLLIGSVSVAEDIRLSIEGQNLKSWLYLNRDFSYNTTKIDILDKPRTYLYVVKELLQNYYLNWRSFYFDDAYSLLRRIYFSVNNKKELFAEEIFVEYMRILDGYHTRIYGDEETNKKIKTALRAVTKDIKEKIFDKDGNPTFVNAIKGVIPDWRYNAKNVEDIAGWIAAGYLVRKSLSHRLQELDDRYLSIMRKNAVEIEKKYSEQKKLESVSDEQLIKFYYKELGDTRNYYSHYKLDNEGVLNFNQMTDSICVLKATIISIFFSHMGMEKELIRKIMVFDCELHWQTTCLYIEGDEPFVHPYEIAKEESTKKED